MSNKDRLVRIAGYTWPNIAAAVLTAFGSPNNAQANTTPDDLAARPWGLDYVGGFFSVGVGAGHLHYRGLCPRIHNVQDGTIIDGCAGTEPINFVAKNPVALSLAIGHRFSRHLALELPFDVMVSSGNGASYQSRLDQGVTLNAAFTVGLRVHGDLPLTQHLALFGTVGVAEKFIDADENQPLSAHVCTAYSAPSSQSVLTPDTTPPTCVAYSADTAKTGIHAVAHFYVPVTVGLEWWPFRHTGFALSYQPPEGHNFAFSEVLLTAIFNQ